ncbi:MAG: hypothetical protein GY734_18010 [Herbaspirillum sp.]|uniref:hypothetical protein n=1 Tax=Herbaspirillum sp. TaxID=1890675 RepID=UPI0025836513|nr:hypothetical protein [Herbaspirillum sp.]MCP3655424.1 hypothetical protein [Herbaspirillum sp.]MCP3947521.1 hypothetical protein [Herbaspirillum sp.]MCP3947526.1 hypothetical protein [Herbaspirillum sp.]MCP4033105.1 hypothetical protein [Herbaspirillum sp.]MCP4556816.1 hypothetical protein [Herbaspirillum sp.]
MGFNDWGDQPVTLPAEAHKDPDPESAPFEPNDDWLAKANEDHQAEAIRQWFHARYWDPANDTPYNGREGGYQFINGSYDPAEVIPERFNAIVHDDVIQKVIEELHLEVGDQWAPIRNYFDDDYYDAMYELATDSPSEPMVKLRDRLVSARQVLTLEGNDEAKLLAKMLVFGNCLGVLEAFLWETAAYWFGNDEKALESLVSKLGHFKEQKMSLSDIYKRKAGLKDEVLGHLQNIVWHRWENVAPIYKLGLDISFPSTKDINEALQIRHDIVHRSGQKKDGSAVQIQDVDLAKLFRDIESFAETISNALSLRPVPNVESSLAEGVAPDF